MKAAIDDITFAYVRRARILLIRQLGNRLQRGRIGQQLQGRHVGVVEQDRLHRQRPTRVVLDLAPTQRRKERVPRHRKQPRARRLWPRLVARHRAQRRGERLGGQVKRRLRIANAATEVAVNRAHMALIEDTERARRLARPHQQLLVAQTLQLHPPHI
jgi:hypothetical protein